MERLFKVPKFHKWMCQTGVTDTALYQSVQEMLNGLIDADLGKGVLKKRISIAGQGKRSGARTIIATNRKNCWFFLFGFRKNEKDNISGDETEALQELASELLHFTESELDYAIEHYKLIEVQHDK